jgi:hypothetical protein
MGKARLWFVICAILARVAVSGGAEGDSGPLIRAEVGVSAAVALAEARIDGLLSCMQVLAPTDEVTSGEWDVMKDILSLFQETSVPLVAWFVLPDGSYYTVTAGRASANLSDRAYFPKVMAGEIAVGYVVVSRSTGRAATVVGVPVVRDGEVIGALGASVFLVELAEIIAADLGGPDDITFYAVGPDSEVTLHSDTDLIMEVAGVPEEDAVSKDSSLLGWTFTLVAEE